MVGGTPVCSTHYVPQGLEQCLTPSLQCKSVEGKHENINCVGDNDNSIYFVGHKKKSKCNQDAARPYRLDGEGLGWSWSSALRGLLCRWFALLT